MNECTKPSVRQSNFELLRIIAILFIILHHISIHGNWGNGSVFFPEELTFNALFLQSILPLGKIGVNLFVFISGYFLINSTKDTWPKIMRLWLEMLFYSIAISIVFIFIDGIEFTPRQIVSIVTPVISDTWWFASVYILLLAFSPFINKMIHSCGERTHLKLVIGLVVLWVIISYLTNSTLELNNLSWFITLYTISAYIRLYPNRFKKYPGTYLTVAIALFIILITITYWIDTTGFTSDFWSIYNPVDYNNRQNSPFAFGISICIFLAFCKWDFKYNPIVNSIAGTTFGIYLIHDHYLIRESIYSRVFDCLGHTYSDYMALYVLMIAGAIFLSCMVIELIRKFTMKPFTDKIEKRIHRFHNKINDLLDKRINNDE